MRSKPLKLLGFWFLLGMVAEICVPGLLQAVDPVKQWTRQLGTSAADYVVGSAKDSSGNIYVAGFINGGLGGNLSNGGLDAFLIKFDSGGQTLWIKQIGTSKDEVAFGVATDPTGNIYVTGATQGTLGASYAGGQDTFLVKYDTSGAKLWTQQLGTPVDDVPFGGVATDTDGYVYVTGFTFGDLDGVNAGPGLGDIYLVQYDPSGAMQWIKQLGTPNADTPNRITTDTSNNIYIAGATTGTMAGNTSAGSFDMVLVKYDSTGALKWIKQLGTSGDEIPGGVATDLLNDVYLVGYTTGAMAGGTATETADFFVVKYDNDLTGTKLWTRQLYLAGGNEIPGWIAVDNSGNAYVVGSTTGNVGGTNLGLEDLFLVKLDPDSTIRVQGKYQFGTSASDRGSGVTVDSYGNVLVAGNTKGGLDGNTNVGLEDIFLMKISPVPINFGAMTIIDTTTTTSIKWIWGDDVTGESAYYVHNNAHASLVTLTANATSWTETGLSPNTSYTRHAVAEVPTGIVESNSDTEYTRASTPINLTMAGRTTTSLTLKWGGDGTRYLVERAPNAAGSPGTYAPIKSWTNTITHNVIDDPSYKVLYADTGLTEGTAYWYRISAYNGDQTLSSPTVALSAMTRSGPSNFTGVALSTTSIGWSWTDGALSELTYYVHNAAHAAMVTLTANAASWTETGLSLNTAYARHAVSEDLDGIVESLSLTLFTQASTPINLTVAGKMSTRLTLKWSGDGTRYMVERAPSDLNSAIGFNLDGTTLFGPGTYATIKSWANAITHNVVDDPSYKVLYTDSGLTKGTTYWYRISAYNGDQTLSSSTVALSGTTNAISETYTISGTLTTNTGSAMSGVTVSLIGVTLSSATTASDGTYSFSTVPMGNYTLITKRTDYVFTPGARGLVLEADTPGQNFVGSLASIFEATEYTSAGTWGSQGSQDTQFQYPFQVAIDLPGNVYVADGANTRIKKFTNTGTLLTTWGGQGSGNGLFYGPHGVVADANGNVYASDVFGNRIQKFTNTGGYVAQWGTVGSGDNQVDAPDQIAVDNYGNVYVVDAGNSRILKFTASGAFLSKWGTPGSGNSQFNTPTSVAVDSAGNVYVADTGNTRIQKFSSTGSFVIKWGTVGTGNTQFNTPSAVAVDAAGNVYVADTNNHCIKKFSATGTFIAKIGSQGTGVGQLSYPTGVAVDPSGKVYVADTNHRVQKFSPKSTEPVIAETLENYSFKRLWGSSGSENGQFNNPYDIAIHQYVIDMTPRTDIYVADSGNHRIQVFSKEGVFLKKIGSAGEGQSNLQLPVGVGVAKVGDQAYVFVASKTSNRITVFYSDGAFKTRMTQEGVPAGLFPLADSQNSNKAYVYVPDVDHDRVFKYHFDLSETGDIPYTEFGTSGPLDGQLNGPSGVAVDPRNGNVYVADTLNHRIQKFDSAGSFLGGWGSQGSALGKFSAPVDVAVDAGGYVYVADTGNNRIQKFSEEGTLVATLTTFISGAGIAGTSKKLTFPVGVAVDTNGEVYVASADQQITVFGPPLPVAPTAFKGTAVSPTSILWTWTDNSTNETEYVIVVAKNGALYTTLPPNAQSFLAISLSPNTAYTGQVLASDAFLNAAKSDEKTVYTYASVPTGLTLLGRSSFRLTLAWSGNGTRYALYRETVGSTLAASMIASWANGLIGTMYVDAGLSPETFYSYRVAAYNAEQTLSQAGEPLIAWTNPAPPGVPTAGTSFTNQSNLIFSWAASPGVGITAYETQVGTTLGTGDVFDGGVGTLLSITLANLQDGTSYYARVRAKNTLGEASDWVAGLVGVGADFTAPPVLTLTALSHPQSTLAYAQRTALLSLVLPQDFSGLSAVELSLHTPLVGTPLIRQTLQPSTLVTLRLAGDGSYALVIHARDGAGNPGQPAFLTLQVKSAIDPPQDNVFLYGDGSSIFIPAGTVSTATELTIARPLAAPTSAFQSRQMKLSKKILDLQLTNGVSSFAKPVALTIAYEAEDVVGLNEALLMVSWFDTTKSVWTPLTDSKVIPGQKKVVATTTHFTTFGIMEFAGTGTALSEAYNYPNPFPPASGTTIRYVLGEPTQSVTIKIYRLNGQLVRELQGTTALDVNDVSWDGQDQIGRSVFSEVLLGVVEAVTTAGKTSRQTIKMAGWNP